MNWPDLQKDRDAWAKAKQLFPKGTVRQLADLAQQLKAHPGWYKMPWDPPGTMRNTEPYQAGGETLDLA